VNEERPPEPSPPAAAPTEAAPTPPAAAPTEAAPTQVSGALPPAPEPAAAPSPPPSQPLPPPAPPALEGVHEPIGAPPSLIENHPEILVGAAFAGGLILATLIRRRGR
jgi:hypothetical protein